VKEAGFFYALRMSGNSERGAFDLRHAILSWHGYCTLSLNKATSVSRGFARIKAARALTFVKATGFFYAARVSRNSVPFRPAFFLFQRGSRSRSPAPVKGGQPKPAVSDETSV
jgi:hypothetical protein